jgi:4-hydroxy-tetrahydrodipicolinate synthase
MQVKYYALIKALFSEVNPIPVKAAMKLLGLDSGKVRLPLYEMEEKNLLKLKAEMEKLNLI